MYSIILRNLQKQKIGLLHIFHEETELYYQMRYLHSTHHSLLALTQQINSLPKDPEVLLPQESLLLPHELLFSAQYLVDLIYQALHCQYVVLHALNPQDNCFYFISGSGLPLSLEQKIRKNDGRYGLSEIFGTPYLDRFQANKEIILTRNRLSVPFAILDPQHSNLDETFLIVPLLSRGRVIGGLSIATGGMAQKYTSEEIEVVRAVADISVLFIESVRALHEWSKALEKESVLQERNRLINDFLVLASHELKTPLTTIMGTIQLIQRRLQRLQSQDTDFSEKASIIFSEVCRSLQGAYQSCCIQQSMLNEMIDDSLIQANKLTLHLSPCDLLEIVQHTIVHQRQQTPERNILLYTQPMTRTIPIFADADRIHQVLNTYLVNALKYSPSNRPVSVYIEIEQTTVRVSVHDEGPGIPPEEQERIWERFYRAKGVGVQHELELSFGLELYICKNLISYHQGQVGIESISGKGSTFWFELPLSRT